MGGGHFAGACHNRAAGKRRRVSRSRRFCGRLCDLHTLLPALRLDLLLRIRFWLYNFASLALQSERF